MIRDDVEMIDLLLKNSANPEIYNNDGETPVFYASNYMMSHFNLKHK